MDIDSRVFISTGAFLERNLHDILCKSLDVGISNLELSSGVAHDRELLKILSLYKSKFRFLVHNYFPAPRVPFVLNLAATDPDNIRRSREHAESAIDLCSTLGSPFYSVHSGFALNLTPELLGHPDKQSRLDDSFTIDSEVAYECFAESIYALNKYADKRGIRLLIENNVITSDHVRHGKHDVFLMVKADEILRLMTEISSPNLGVLVDVGHLKVSAKALEYDPYDFISEIKSHIRAYHLSDNDGNEDQNLEISKNSWFWSSIKKCVDTTLVLEVYRLESDDILRQRELVRKLSS